MAETIPVAHELPCVGQPGSADTLDAAGYLEANPDVKASGVGAREHYLSEGQAQGRLQAINQAEVARLRDRKLSRIAFRVPQRTDRKPGAPANFLAPETIAEFGIPDAPPVSDHPYPPPIIDTIRANPDRTFLDVGAGLRHTYYHNVINTEIYPSVSTDVMCVGEDLPFADEQFDFVFCFATLEHTRRPWDVAREICRVLKPGGTVLIDYPFMQPVHGYPHHYFNATPEGNRSLFEDYCDIRSVDVGWHHHPIIGVQWTLTAFRNGLPEPEARRFEQMPIGDLLDKPVDSLIAASFSRSLHPDMQRVIASGSLLTGVKRPGVVITRSQAATDKALADLRQENGRLRQDMEIIRGSTSWRLTTPLRAVGRLFRR